MAGGVARLEWAQTSLVAALVANTMRDPKKRHAVYKPSEFDPWAEIDRKKRPVHKGDITMLKVFLSRKGGSHEGAADVNDSGGSGVRHDTGGGAAGGA